MLQLRKELVGGRLGRLLCYEDRNSMRFSIESRVPFLSLDFVEFMLSLPATFLVSSTAETKSVLREAMRGIVPDAVLNRTDKVGFSTPEASWFKANFANFMATGPSDVSDQFIDMDVAKLDIMKSIEKAVYKPELWRLVNFQKWRASNIIREQR
jgi:asparagine synthase (glutamine-hydrolysing)